MEGRRLLEGLLVALVASGLTLGVHSLVGPSSVAAPFGSDVLRSGREDGTHADLAALVRDARALVEQLRSAAAAQTARPIEAAGTRRSATESADEPATDSGRIADLHRRLNWLERAVRAQVPFEGGPRPLDRQRPMSPQALLRAVELNKTDPEAFESDTTARTMHEIIQRFGYPRHISASDEHFWFVYDLSSVSPDYESLTFYFRWGRVAFAQIRTR